jgi:acyl carrier protein
MKRPVLVVTDCMDKNTMALETVRECLISAFALDETEAHRVDQATTAADLKQWDSLGRLMLIVELENRFGVEFSDDETVELSSVDAILRILEKKER